MKKHTFPKRLLPLALAAVMLLTTVPAAAVFRDAAGHWAEETLSEWQAKGWIDGYADGSFRPDGTVTRAGFVKMVNRALNFTAEAAVSFTDVEESDWFYPEVAKAAAAGYAQGSGGAFHPMQAITRAQAAVMLVRVAGLAAEETYADTFADAASIPAWAKGSIGAAAQAGLMHGYADGTFRAEGLITRAQAVVTLDRMVNRAADTVIETAGTVLENAAAAGNLVIAASVGEGEVTLKNVTVQGDLIVRGGGADSVYLDNVQVSGTVRLEKEYVHLHLMGGTVLERVEIRRPCRMTRDNSLRSRLGRLVIDLEKDSDREIQIEVPAERVELLSKAGAVLGADAETLRIGTGAEGAQLSIRSGATVEELTADARAKLTGSGTVSRLVVSVSGVSVSGSLTVKKIETLNGAKAPTVSGGSGGSSGGGTAPLRRITGAAPVPDVTVDYGTSEADAMAGLPGTVVLEAAENGSVSTVSAAVHWALDSVYDAYPLTERTYTAAGTVTIPAGYTYSGTLTVTTKLTVRGANPHAVIAEIWTVTGLELPFGAERRDAVLPIAVTVEDGSGSTMMAEVTWALNGTWKSPGVNTFTGTVTMPAGYTYQGAAAASVTTTVTVAESGAVPKTKTVVNSVDPDPTSIGYAETEELVLAAARTQLPAAVTLECGDGSCIAAAVSRDDWRFLYSGYRGTPENTRTVSLTVDVSLPMGYAGQGEKTAAYCAVEVRALDTAALDAALAAAAALQSKLVYNAAEAAGDAIYVTGDPNNPTDAADIPAGVKFVDNADGCADAFTAAAARADQAKVAGFASQQACNDRTEELRSAMETFRAAVQTGTGTNTDAYIRPLVEALLTLESNLDAPYHPDRQPLKAGTFHPLYHTGGVSLPGSDMRLDSVAWSAAGKGAPYVTIGADAADPDRYGAAIAQAPDAPQQVTFVAEAVCSNSRTGAATTLTFDYPAVIAAPLRVDADKSTREITLISGQENRFSAWLGFAGDGGDAIEGVNGRVQGVSGEFGTITSEATVESFNNALTGERYPVIRGGAFTVTPEALAAVYCTNEWQVPHETSALELSIAGDAVRVENGGSWYAPEGNLTHTVENVKVYHPAITYVITWMKTKAETAGEDSEVQVTLNTLYFGDYGLKMAFTREDTAPDGLPEDEVIYLDFGAEDAVENGAYGKDFVKTVTGKFVFDKQYWYWYKVDNGASGWVQGGATVYSSETWEG